MKKIFRLMVVLLLISCFAEIGFADSWIDRYYNREDGTFVENYKPGSEPDDFRGIKWGTDVKSLPDMKKLTAIIPEIKPKPIDIWDRYQGFSGLEQSATIWYTRKGEKLKIGEEELEQIFYGFIKDKLYCVFIPAKNTKTLFYENLPGSTRGLKEIMFKRFGPGSKRKVEYSSMRWRGSIFYYWHGNTTLIILTSSTFTMKSTVMWKQCTYHNVKTKEEKRRLKKEKEAWEAKRKREKKEKIEKGAENKYW